ncbi:AIR synthase [Candidatus Gottesmanbacteria bacterium]|nr:AIR synthase [Candidatus Gottesmanbacteria bacterium]
MYNHTTNQQSLPILGKIHPDFFNKIIYPRLGAADPKVLIGPRAGVDFGVIDLGDEVMVLSTDPFYIAKELGIKKAAWFAVHIVASDVAVSGIQPKYLTIDLNLPPEMTEHELSLMWEAVDEECKKLSINIITGHTARYAGCNYPMVGGATVIGIGKKEKLISPQARIGDVIIITKGPAIETTGLLATYFPDVLKNKFDDTTVTAAQEIYYQMSTVKDAAIVADVGGATAMHDATECGIWGGLYEMAKNSKVGMNIYQDAIIVQSIVQKTCAAFNIDPYQAISEGTLLVTADKNKAKAIITALKQENIPASICGEIIAENEGLNIIKQIKIPLEHPKIDPFWICFEDQLTKKANKNIAK